jgi:hypothetical protein
MRSLKWVCLLVTPLSLLPSIAQAQAADHEIVEVPLTLMSRDVTTSWSETAYCPDGKVAVGGGWHLGGSGSVHRSHPVSSATHGSGWEVSLSKEAGTPQGFLRVYATCVSLPGVPLRLDGSNLFMTPNFRLREYDGNFGANTLELFWARDSGTGKLVMFGNRGASMDLHLSDGQLHTGDIVFGKGDQKLWRMFEDEQNLYVENLIDKKVYSLVLKEIGR